MNPRRWHGEAVLFKVTARADDGSGAAGGILLGFTFARWRLGFEYDWRSEVFTEMTVAAGPFWVMVWSEKWGPA